MNNASTIASTLFGLAIETASSVGSKVRSKVAIAATMLMPMTTALASRDQVFLSIGALTRCGKDCPFDSNRTDSFFQPYNITEEFHVDFVKRHLSAAGIEVLKEKVTGDDSRLLKLTNDNSVDVDVFPNGDVVVIVRKNGIRSYDQYSISEMAEAILTIKHELQPARVSS